MLERTDTVDVISSRVDLKKKGNSYLGLCPFHKEKTPSFSVSVDKSLYHCFGCKASGDVIEFLMQHDHISFIEAIQELADKAGMEVEKDDDPEYKKRQQSKQPLYDALEKASAFFRKQLQNHSIAQNYLSNRNISTDVSDTYNLGYAPPGNSLFRALRTKISEQILIQSGLLATGKDNSTYDRFRNRIMFPIRDIHGRVSGFGARAITPESQPKYLNSPESPVFHKKQELYGLYETISVDRKNLKSLIFVEGYTDVLTLAQAGIKNAVACLGTALTTEHIKCAFRVTNSIYFCFDGDEAGQIATWNSLKIIMPLLHKERQVSFMLLPNNTDPDSFLREHGAEAFKHKIKTLALAEFLLQGLMALNGPESIDKKARLIRKTKQLIQTVSDEVLRLLLFKELEKVTGIDYRPATTPSPLASFGHNKSFTVQSNLLPKTMSLSTRIIKAILASPDRAFDGFPNNLKESDLDWLKQKTKNPGAEADISLLYDLCVDLINKPTTNSAVLLGRLSGHSNYQHLKTLALQNDMPILDTTFTINSNKELIDCWKRLQKKKSIVKKKYF